MLVTLAIAALVATKVAARPGPAIAAPARGPVGGATRAEPTTTTTQPPPATNTSTPARIVTPGLDAPNPFVMVDGGSYYLYSSQWSISSPSIPVRESTTRDSWPSAGRLLGSSEAFPHLPGWIQPGFTWAPDVRRIGGQYVMWYTAWLRHHFPQAECIGVATSPSPLGPFTATSPYPSICQLDRYGSIDPRTFVDSNGQLWLYWKSDDNADVRGTTHSSIYAQQLSTDGLDLIGNPTQILQADQVWEGRIVEAPDMVLVGGRYWLFYSGNWFNEVDYGIGIASCVGPAGPCTKPLAHAWLGSNSQGAGPGEESLFSDSEGTWIVYSPWAVVYPHTNTPRPVAMARVGFGPAGPYVAQW